jgi:hypothetical protein
MNSHIVAAIATAATVILSAGCSTSMSQPSTSSAGAPPSSSSAGYDERQCQVFRSYQRDKAPTALMEECSRQMGVDACNKCLGTR